MKDPTLQECLSQNPGKSVHEYFTLYPPDKKATSGKIEPADTILEETTPDKKIYININQVNILLPAYYARIAGN